MEVFQHIADITDSASRNLENKIRRKYFGIRD